MAARSRAPAATSGAPSTQWWPQTACSGSPPRLVIVSESASALRPASSRITRSSRNGEIGQSTVNRTATAASERSTWLHSHPTVATSPWNGSARPRCTQASFVLGKSSCQPPS